MTLTEFLLARIDEDERVAKILLEDDHRPLLSVALTVDHPTRFLAECEAKRRIVRAAESAPTSDGLRFAVAVLASVYADHPDYRQEWRA